MNLERYLDRRQREIHRALDRYVPDAKRGPTTLVRAMRYSLLAGGKRIRPILTLATAEAVGGLRKPVLPWACAIEMVHTYSLVHDDLPAMDDDDLRRGRPTAHVVFGEAVAILAGDALLTEAFHLMTTTALGDGCSKPRALRVIQEVATAAGMRGMIMGQVADIEAERSTPDLPTVEFIHVRKTGALLLAAVRAGALLAGATVPMMRRLTRYGECLGLVFQIADDILDAEAPTSVTGKRAGRDHALQKATYPAVMGMPGAKALARALLTEAIEAVVPLGRRADPLRAIARYVVGRAAQA